MADEFVVAEIINSAGGRRVWTNPGLNVQSLDAAIATMKVMAMRYPEKEMVVLGVAARINKTVTVEVEVAANVTHLMRAKK